MLKLGITICALFVVTPLSPAQAQDRTASPNNTITLTVQENGALPGFNTEGVTRYLVDQMSNAAVTGWTFAPASTSAAADRVEWNIREEPYAGGGIRQFIPIPSLRRIFGPHHLMTVEVRLYLGGQYQTLASGQVLIQGGAGDKDLAAFVVELTQNLLGAHGAYRSIDVAQSQTR